MLFPEEFTAGQLFDGVEKEEDLQVEFNSGRPTPLGSSKSSEPG